MLNIPRFLGTPGNTGYDPLAAPYPARPLQRRSSDPGPLGRSRQDDGGATGAGPQPPGGVVSALNDLAAPVHPEFAATPATTIDPIIPIIPITAATTATAAPVTTTAEPVPQALRDRFSECLEVLHPDQGPFGLAQVADQIRALCIEAGVDLAESSPETLLYLRYPHLAGDADRMGRGAQSLSAVVNALGRTVRDQDPEGPMEEGDMAGFRSVLDWLFAQIPARPLAPVGTTPPLAADPFADAPRQLLSAQPDSARRKLQALADALAPDPAVAGRIAASLELYRTRYRGHGPQFDALMETLSVRDLLRLMGSVHIYGPHDAAICQRMTFERDIQNLSGRNGLRDFNRGMLGCDESFVASPDGRDYRGPTAQVGFETRVAMYTSDGGIRYPRVLHFSAPPLDSPRQVEFPLYIHNGSLLMEQYQDAITTLFDLVRQAVTRERPGRMVLTAIGSGAFLNGVPQDQRPQAREVLVREMADTVVWLRTQGVPVVYTDLTDAKPFWHLLDQELAQRGQESVGWIGRMPGDWVRDGDAILNSGDTKATLGNGGSHDFTADGGVNIASTGQVQHVCGCCCHAHGVAPVPRQEVVTRF